MDGGAVGMVWAGVMVMGEGRVGVGERPLLVAGWGWAAATGSGGAVGGKAAGWMGCCWAAAWMVVVM